VVVGRAAHPDRAGEGTDIIKLSFRTKSFQTYFYPWISDKFLPLNFGQIFTLLFRTIFYPWILGKFFTLQFRTNFYPWISDKCHPKRAEKCNSFWYQFYGVMVQKGLESQYVPMNLYLTILIFIRKFRPKRFHT
jgi:hypothetical protein